MAHNDGSKKARLLALYAAGALEGASALADALAGMFPSEISRALWLAHVESARLDQLPVEQAASSSRTPRDVQYDPQAGDTKRWQGGSQETVQEYVVRKRGGAYLTLEVHYFATSAVDIVRRHVEYWACEGAHCDWMYSAGVVDAPTGPT